MELKTWSVPGKQADNRAQTQSRSIPCKDKRETKRSNYATTALVLDMDLLRTLFFFTSLASYQIFSYFYMYFRRVRSTEQFSHPQPFNGE
jgi:hypothetical protein